MAAQYLKAESNNLFSANSKLLFERSSVEAAGALREDNALYEVRAAKKRLE
jgi:hypothetical protein